MSNHPLITPAVRFLFTRRNIKMYGSTYTNAQVTEALLAYARMRKESTPSLTLSVAANGKQLYQQQVNTMAFRGSATLPVNTSIEITVTGVGLLLWDLTTEHAFTALPSGRQSNTFSIERTYEN